jgi:predicted dehydrogenase
LCEKPLAPSISQARELVELARVKDVPLMCGLLERYNPAIQTAKTLVSDPVLVRTLRHSPYAPRIKTGVAWDLAVHDVDLAIQLVPGGVEQASGQASVVSPQSLQGAEDIVEATIQFDSGALASVSAGRVAQRKLRQVTIFELDRMIEVDLLLRTVTVWHHVAQDALTPDGRGYRQQAILEIPELVTNREPLASQLDRFVAVVTGTADVDEERETILPAHEVIAEVLNASELAEVAT